MRAVRGWRGSVALIALVDVTFLLILFLVLAGRFETTGVLALQAPGPATAEQVPAVLVRLGPDGSVDLAGEPLPVTTLIERLGGRDGLVVLVRVDAEARLVSLVGLLDALTGAGITDVALLAS
jgi:biopolymer transport protein ExbD